MLANWLHSYELSEVEDNQYGGKTEDGTWTGMVGKVLRKVIRVLVQELFVDRKRAATGWKADQFP